MRRRRPRRVSGASLADPTNEELAQQTQTLFRGETPARAAAQRLGRAHGGHRRALAWIVLSPSAPCSPPPAAGLAAQRPRVAGIRRRAARARRPRERQTPDRGRTGASAPYPRRHATLPPLRDLLTTQGPSGYERRPPRSGARRRATSPRTSAPTSWARARGRVPGDGGGPLVAVVGHIDEIGLIVTHIDDEGFLWFTDVGGWDPRSWSASASRCRPRGEVPGVVGKKPIHLLKNEERKKAPKLSDLHIDVGAKDGDEARSLVRIGDVAVIDGEPVELPNGRVVSRSMDNRLGCFVALEAARLVAEAGGAPGDVAAAAVAGGDRPSAARARSPTPAPDVAIVVDVTHATDAPGIDVQRDRQARVRLGPRDRARLDAHPRIFELLHETAEARGHPVHGRRVRRARRAPTRTRSTSSRAGVPSGVVSIPLRYMHSPVEIVQLDDVDNAARLIAAFAQRPDARHGLPRAEPPPLLLLFDIDGTLLQRAAPSTRGRCIEAIGDVCGVDAGGDAAVEAAGRTDIEIARDLLLPPGSPPRASTTAADAARGRGRGATRDLCPHDLAPRLAPGIVRAARRAGRPRETFLLSLVTGNLSRSPGSSSARRDRPFLPGRPGRLRLRPRGPRRAAAVARAAPGRRTPPYPRERTVVIGDTPRDIACARADGVRVAAVATGPFAVGELAEADAVAADGHALHRLVTGLLG